MKLNIIYRYLLIITCLFVYSPVNADFFQYNHCDGWHFYCENKIHIEKPIKTDKEEKQTEKKEEQEIKEETSIISLNTDQSKNEKKLVEGSTEWLQVNLPKIRDQAIDNPSYDNVRLYAYFQRMGIDKADKFSTMYERVLKSDPFLDENNRMTTSPTLIPKVGSRMRDNRDTLFKRIAKDRAFFFFFDSECPSCELMSRHMQMIEKKYDAVVIAVSSDGKPLDNGLYPDFIKDEGQINALNIFAMPAVVAYDQISNEWTPIAYGFNGRDTVINYAMSVGVNKGWITEDEWFSTKESEHHIYLDSPWKNKPVNPQYLELFKTLHDNKEN